MIKYGIHSTTIGYCLLALYDNKICFLAFYHNIPTDLTSFLKQGWPSIELQQDQDFTQKYMPNFSFPHRPCSLELYECRGTLFQKAVWQALLTIPYGSTVTYQAIAHKIGNPTAVRAVANAIGANPISYFIPCHRVIRTSGALGGYRWGIEFKKKLLALEQAL